MAITYRTEVLEQSGRIVILGRTDKGIQPSLTVIVEETGAVTVLGSPAVTLLSCDVPRVDAVRFGEIRGSVFLNGLGVDNKIEAPS